MLKQISIYALYFGFILGAVPLSLEAQEHEKSTTLKYEPQLAGEIYRFSMQSTGRSYYFNDMWLKGDVLLVSGKKVHNKYLKYNIFIDELVWLSEMNHQQVKVDKELVEEFTIYLPGNAIPFVFKKIPMYEPLSLRPKYTFLQELYRGNVSLMLQWQVIRSGERISSTGSSLYRVSNLRLNQAYYIVKPDNEIVRLGRFKRMSLYRMFPDNADEIKKAFRGERLTIRNEGDLIRAVSIIDNIISQ